MRAWLAANRDELLRLVLAGVLVLILWSVMVWAGKSVRASRWLRVLLATLVLAAGYVLLWVRYPLFRVYVTPALTFAAGLLVGLLWSRRGLAAPRGRAPVRLSDLQRRGSSWQDSLLGGAVDLAKWQIVDSEPAGMVEPTTEGLVVTWREDPLGYAGSGFLVARLELDEADFYVQFEAMVEHYGTGWDAGLHLLVEAEPRGTVCAAMRYLPAPWSGAEYNAFCFLVSNERKGKFQVPAGEWMTARIEVSGNAARAVVVGSATAWEHMPTRPRRLVLGATPVGWPAKGSYARYLFRNLKVKPGHPSQSG